MTINTSFQAISPFYLLATLLQATRLCSDSKTSFPHKTQLVVASFLIKNNNDFKKKQPILNITHPSQCSQLSAFSGVSSFKPSLQKKVSRPQSEKQTVCWAGSFTAAPHEVNEAAQVFVTGLMRWAPTLPQKDWGDRGGGFQQMCPSPAKYSVGLCDSQLEMEPQGTCTLFPVRLCIWWKSAVYS